MIEAEAKPVVRPGRVDDLAFAITKRVVALKANPVVQQVFTEAEPIIKALYTRGAKALGILRMPGIPSGRARRKKAVADAR